MTAAAGLRPRDRLLVAGCIVLVAALAWAYLVHLERRMSHAADSVSAMAAMGMVVDAPWGASDAALTFAMWAVMMVGMMSAPAAPMLMLVAEMQARRAAPVGRAVLPFALGYLAVWLGFSAAATLAQWGLHDAALLSPMLAASSPLLGGTILIAAGAWQFTPIKGACLRQCRSPLGFLMGNWRDGPRGAFEMGLRHGIHCLGCCWALMVVLFAVGVMNLAWVAALSVFVLLEKVGRRGERLARAGGLAMIALGIVLVAR